MGNHQKQQQEVSRIHHSLAKGRGVPHSNSLPSWAHDMFGPERQDRVLIYNTPMMVTRVWFLGDTGNGKTTTVGQLAARSDVKGRDGFSHHTKRIAEYDLNYIHHCIESTTKHVEGEDAVDDNDNNNNETTTPVTTLYSHILVDTRGTSDIGVDVHYSARDLFIDMNHYHSYAEASKVVFVLMNRRLQPGQLKMIRDLYHAFDSRFLILVTGTMDLDGHSRAELLRLLQTHGIEFTGTILAVDWFHHQSQDNDQEAIELVQTRRSTILDALEQLESVDVRKLRPHGRVVQHLNRVEDWCQEWLRIPYVVDGVALVAVASLLLLGTTKVVQGLGR